MNKRRQLLIILLCLAAAAVLGVVLAVRFLFGVQETDGQSVPSPSPTVQEGAESRDPEPTVSLVAIPKGLDYNPELFKPFEENLTYAAYQAMDSSAKASSFEQEGKVFYELPGWTDTYVGFAAPDMLAPEENRLQDVYTSVKMLFDRDELAVTELAASYGDTFSVARYEDDETGEEKCTVEVTVTVGEASYLLSFDAASPKDTQITRVHIYKLMA